MQRFGFTLLWLLEHRDCYIILCTEHGLHNSVHSMWLVLQFVVIGYATSDTQN